MKGNKVRIVQMGMGWFSEQPGGLNRYYYELVRQLPSFEIEVAGMVAGTPRVAIETTDKVRSFAPHKEALPSRLLKSGQSLQALVSEFNPDLLVSHFPLYAVPALLKWPVDLPWVHHFHGPWALEASAEGSLRFMTWIRRFIENRVYRRPGCFIVLSSAFRDLLYRQYRVPLERIRVIPGGVDMNRFTSNPSQREARDFFKLPHGRPVILAVRRLAKRMGLENLLLSFDQVRRQFPDALLVIAGKGPLQSALSKIIEEHHLENHVYLLGYVKDDVLPLLYRVADVTIVPSITLEGFGLIVLESLSCGVPALVSPVGGLPEIVNNLESGLVLPGNGIDDLRAGLIEFLRNRELFPSGSECRNFVEKYYDWPIVVEQIASTYRSVI